MLLKSQLNDGDLMGSISMKRNRLCFQTKLWFSSEETCTESPLKLIFPLAWKITAHSFPVLPQSLVGAGIPRGGSGHRRGSSVCYCWWVVDSQVLAYWRTGTQLRRLNRTGLGPHNAGKAETSDTEKATLWAVSVFGHPEGQTVFISVFRKHKTELGVGSPKLSPLARRPRSSLHWRHTVDICCYCKSTCALETDFVLWGKTFLKPYLSYGVKQPRGSEMPATFWSACDRHWVRDTSGAGPGRG